jgi:dTDP-4-amino-4,6-dideoxygalactose transaminase
MNIETKTTPVPLLDLVRQYRTIQGPLFAAVTRVIESQRFILGPDVERFEKRFAAYCGAKHAIGCGSGTDALELALLACGVGPGDEVLTVPYTFFATGGAILSVGATPVFVDVAADTFNLDTNQLNAVLARHPKVKAILPVHLFGACADMQPILDAAAKRHIPVIEDAAQSIGAEYKGRRAGALGTVACFSFFPTKNLGGFGDGGALTTGDDVLADRLRRLRVHGSSERYVHHEAGMNSRLDALQAAVLDVKLDYVDQWSDARARNAALYHKLLRGAVSGAVSRVLTLPDSADYQTRHVFNQYVIRTARRDELRTFLGERGVGVEVYYPIPVHLQPALSGYGFKTGDFPVSEQLARETLALPIFAELTTDEISTVAGLILEFHQQ